MSDWFAFSYLFFPAQNPIYFFLHKTCFIEHKIDQLSNKFEIRYCVYKHFNSRDNRVNIAWT